VIDPEGEFATLRERSTTSSRPSHGETTRRRIRAAPSSWPSAARARDIGDPRHLRAEGPRADPVRPKLFLEALVDAPKKLWHPALVVVDEAHVFCPQQGEAESADAVKDLATRGRKRGFCAVLATQRISKLHKDAAAELNNKLIGRTGLDVDMKRAADELGLVGKDEMRELRTLAPGEFFAFGPALSQSVKRIQVGDVQTSHPKAGSRIAFSPPPPTAKIKALLPQLADLPAEAEERAKTLQDAQKEIANLKRELTIAKKAQPAPAKAETKVIEKAVLKDGQLGRVEKLYDRVFALANKLQTLATPAYSAAAEITAAVRQVNAPLKSVPMNGVLVKAESTYGVDRPNTRTTLRLGFERPPTTTRPPTKNTTGDQAIGAGERKVLTAIAQHPDGVTREQLTVLTGYKRSSRDTYLQRLGAGGYVELSRDRILVAANGLAALGDDFEPLPTGSALLDHWMRELPEGERRVLEVAVAAYPDQTTRDAITEVTGYKRSSRDTYLQRLGARRLVDANRDGVLAAKMLFDA
jgi:hypothetical protein